MSLKNIFFSAEQTGKELTSGRLNRVKSLSKGCSGLRDPEEGTRPCLELSGSAFQATMLALSCKGELGIVLQRMGVHSRL